ncbi:MAG: hypothetical protein CMO80_14150 [Verrucomicrobiales bacterium]|nr:hypothetical protein [Verrucomicrobiales bacterium]
MARPTQLPVAKSSEQDKKKSRKPRKPTRFKPETRAKREIRKQQNSQKSLLKKVPFERAVREAVQNNEGPSGTCYRMTKGAFAILRAVSQDVLTDLMTATEIIRQKQGTTKSILPEQMEIARGLIHVKCLSNTQLPMHISLGQRRANKEKKKSVVSVQSTV